MQRGSESKQTEGRKQRSRDEEGDREKKEQRREAMLKPQASVGLQMIAFHKVVFYATLDLLSFYGSSY